MAKKGYITRDEIREHIRGFYSFNDLKHQVYEIAKNEMKNYGYKTWFVRSVGLKMVQGGCFLISDKEIKDFLSDHGIDGRYSSGYYWGVYQNSIAGCLVDMFGSVVRLEDCA